MKIKKRTGNAVFATAGLNSGFEAFVQFSSFVRVEIFRIFIPAIANTNRCAKVSASAPPFAHQTRGLHPLICQRSTLRFDLQHISGFAKFPFLKAELSERKLRKSARLLPAIQYDITLTTNKTNMKQIDKTFRMKSIFILLVFMSLKVVGQVPPAGKYDTTNYPKDRKIINSISNIFDKSLSLNDNSVSIGADGTISYGIDEELQKFVKNGMTFKSVVPVPGTELVRIFNGNTAIKTKVADVIFSTPNGDLYFKVIRAETYIKQKGKWYFVLGQGTNFMTQEEFDEYKRLHTVKN